MVKNLLRKWGLMAKKPKTPNARDPYRLQADRTKGDISRSQYNVNMMSGPRTNVWGTQSTKLTPTEYIDPYTKEKTTVMRPETSFEFNPEAQQFQKGLWGALNTGGTEQTILDKYESLYNPMLDKRRQALEAQRAAQGITAGSGLYSDLENDIMRGEGDIRNKFVLDAWQTGMADRAQNFNFLQGMNQGSQQFASNPAINAALIGGSDYLQSSNAAQNDKWNKYNADYADWEKTPSMWDIAGGVVKGGLGMALTGNPYAGALIGLGQGNMFGKDGLFGQKDAPWWSRKG